MRSDHDPESWVGLRRSDDVKERPLNHVPLREIGNAMVHDSAKAAGFEEEEELLRAALANFGGKRLTDNVTARLREALRLAARARRLERNGAVWVVVDLLTAERTDSDRLTSSSMGRVGSWFDNAAAEAFFSSLEWEVLCRHTFTDTRAAQAVVMEWCYDFYNTTRRHSAAGMQSLVNFETARQIEHQTAALNRHAA